MSLNIKRIQLTENGDVQDVDILTSADSVTFEDGDTLQVKLDNGDIVSSDVLGDVDSLDGSNVVDSLNGLNDSAKETSKLVGELANRPSVTSALRKEAGTKYTEVKISNLPFSLYVGSAVVHDNEIHILEGDKTTDARHYKWNGSAWESVSILPYGPDWYGIATEHNGAIHLMGGGSSETYKAHYKWNGSTWESASTAPYNYQAGGLVSYGNELHLLGGGNSSSTRAYHYKWNGSTWSSASTLPKDTSDRNSFVVHDNAIYYNNYKSLYKWSGSSWTTVSSSLTVYFSTGCLVDFDGCIYMFSGYSSTQKLYKFNGTDWEEVIPLQYSPYRGNAVVYNGELVQLGGYYNKTIHRAFRYIDVFYINGYSKADTDIYLPISTTPLTSNLTATEDGYTVTEDGYVEILLNE